MSSVPLHPALVHLPIGLSIVVPVVAIALAIAVWRGALGARAWWVVVALQAIVLAGGLAAARAGERDEERVEAVVSERLIHEHEERAEAFLWAAGVAAAVAAAAVLLPARRIFMPLATAASLVTAGLALYTGKAGGELVYQHGAARAYLPGSAAAPIAHEEGQRRRGGHRETGRED